MTITERVAFLKGLIEGLGVNEDTKEGKIIKVMADILEDMSLAISDFDDAIGDLEEQVEVIDEDLETLEEDFYGDDDDDDDCCCDDEGYEVECPSCGEVICLDDDMLKQGEIECPACGEALEFEFEDEGCDCGEDCDCESNDEE